MTLGGLPTSTTTPHRYNQATSQQNLVGRRLSFISSGSPQSSQIPTPTTSTESENGYVHNQCKVNMILNSLLDINFNNILVFTDCISSKPVKEFVKTFCCLDEYVGKKLVVKPDGLELAQLSMKDLGKKQIMFTKEDYEKEVYLKLRV